MADQFITEGFSYKVTVTTYTPTQIGLNIMYWKCVSLILNDTTLQNMADRFNTLWAFTYKQAISENAKYRGVTVQQVTPVTTPQWSAVGSDGPGSVVGNMAPTQTAGVIAKRSAIGGRHGRGRLYIPFPSVSDVTATGGPSAGYLTVLGSFVTMLGADVTVTNGASSAVMRQVIRRVQAGVINYDYVVQLLARNKFGTQRRRGQFGATNIPAV